MEATTREVKFYRVDVVKAIRKSEKLPKEKFKEIVIYSKAHKRNENWKKEMGKLGLMLIEDYDVGAYADYGLNKERIEGSTQIEKLTDSNSDLQKKIAELEAQVANKNQKNTTEQSTK